MAPSAIPLAPPARRRATLPMASALALATGALVLVAVVLVLGISWTAGRRNTLELLQDKSNLQLDLIAARIRGYLDGPQDQLQSLAMSAGSPDADPGAIRQWLAGALAAMPEVARLTYRDPDSGEIAIMRRDGAIVPAPPDGAEEAGRPPGPGAPPVWGVPVFDTASQQALLDVRVGAQLAGHPRGSLTAALFIRPLSAELDAGAGIGLTPFVLYGGRSVLAHPRLGATQPAALSAAKPLPTVDDIGDPVIARIWTTRDVGPINADLLEPIGGHIVRASERNYLLVYRELPGFQGLPLIIGGYVPAEAASLELRRLLLSGIGGIAILLVAIASAVIIGRLIARPIRRAAGRAAQLGQLEFEQSGDLPGSMIRELNDQAYAFNTMTASLRWFETYVPKRLVQRLLAKGEQQTIVSVVRELTIMFTDIAGFTAAAERQDPNALAAFLNAHFALIAACVEAEDGTIDKFMGDALMAFWSAPDWQEDHAARACRAALAIARAVEADNAARQARGEPAVELRIGIHSGEALAGNIGAPSRMNYTIVGDAVNTCQRLQLLAAEIARGAGNAVTIAISAATAAALDDSFVFQPWGWQAMRGRSEPVEVFRLIGLADQPKPAGTGATAVR